MRPNVLSLPLFLALVLGCTDGSAAPGQSARTTAASIERVRDASTPRMDSTVAIDTMIARFQSQLPRVTMLSADAPRSMDELVGRLIAAVEKGSDDDLRMLTMTVAEFAYLYFPTSIYTRAPYRQPPEVNWLLLEQNSLKGERRLMREYGGTRLPADGYRCIAEPRVEGRNRIREHCVVLLRTATDGRQAVRLFGSIIERDGRFKLMSLANRL